MQPPQRLYTDENFKVKYAEKVEATYIDENNPSAYEVMIDHTIDKLLSGGRVSIKISTGALFGGLGWRILDQIKTKLKDRVSKSSYEHCLSRIKVVGGSSGGAVGVFHALNCEGDELRKKIMHMTEVDKEAFSTTKSITEKLGSIAFSKFMPFMVELEIDNTVVYGDSVLSRILLDNQSEVIALFEKNKNALFGERIKGKGFINDSILRKSMQQILSVLEDEEKCKIRDELGINLTMNSISQLNLRRLTYTDLNNQSGTISATTLVSRRNKYASFLSGSLFNPMIALGGGFDVIEMGGDEPVLDSVLISSGLGKGVPFSEAGREYLLFDAYWAANSALGTYVSDTGREDALTINILTLNQFRLNKMLFPIPGKIDYVVSLNYYDETIDGKKTHRASFVPDLLPKITAKEDQLLGM